MIISAPSRSLQLGIVHHPANPAKSHLRGQTAEMLFSDGGNPAPMPENLRHMNDNNTLKVQATGGSMKRVHDLFTQGSTVEKRGFIGFRDQGFWASGFG